MPRIGELQSTSYAETIQRSHLISPRHVRPLKVRCPQPSTDGSHTEAPCRFKTLCSYSYHVHSFVFAYVWMIMALPACLACQLIEMPFIRVSPRTRERLHDAKGRASKYSHIRETYQMREICSPLSFVRCREQSPKTQVVLLVASCRCCS